MTYRQERVKRLREEFPKGATVELIHMDDPFRVMPKGLRGVVTHVDDACGIHINWENGSTLAAIDGVDAIRRIAEC